MFSYDDFISRNWLFIDSPLQDSIKDKTLLILGCGLGSVIADMAVRLGFENFILIDGDNVEISNLNRQIFTIKDEGKNKAEALASHIKSINPASNIRVYNKFITDSVTVFDFIQKSHYVINSIDVNKEYFDSIRMSSANNLTTLLPFNIGFGGLVIVVPPEAKKTQRLLQDFGDAKDDLSFLMILLQKGKRIKAPSYILKRLPKIMREIKNRKYNSQTGISSYLTASITMTVIIKLINNQRVKMYPRVNQVDLFNKL